MKKLLIKIKAVLKLFKENVRSLFDLIHLLNRKIYKSDQEFDDKKIDEFFSRYSQQDIAKSLFVISTWTKNRSSDLKIKYAYICFLSGKNFSLKDTIIDYSHFTSFYNELITILPSFPTLEDFVPKGDWGEIKYFFREQSYKILYGSKLSMPYDLLTSFEIICSSIEQEIQSVTDEHPLNHLEEMLKLSDSMINSLKADPSITAYDDISPGHIEIPSQEYWNNCKQFFKEFNPYGYSREFLERFTIKVGDYNSENRDLNKFIKASYEGSLVQFMFIKTNKGIFPASPSWFIPVLIDSWSKTFDKIYPILLKIEDLNMPVRIGFMLGKMIENRIIKHKVSRFVHFMDKDKKPDKFVFPFMIQSKKSLYFFSFLSPHLDENTIDEKLKNIHQGIESAKTLFNKNLTLGLSFEKQLRVYEGNKQPVLKFIVIYPHLSTSRSCFEIPEYLDATVLLMEELIAIIDELENVDKLDEFFEFINSNKDKTGPFIDFLDHLAAFKYSDGILVEGAIEPSAISLDPSSGNDLRYQTLLRFWSLFPKVNFLGHPRDWFVFKDASNRIRLMSRSRLRLALYFEIGDTSLYINAPFEFMDNQTGSITDCISQCLEHYFSKLSSTLQNHLFFKFHKKVRIFLSPKGLISDKNQQLNHLEHLKELANPFAVDSGNLKGDWIGFRYIFDEIQMPNILSGQNGKSGEILIIKTLIDEIEKRFPDPKVDCEINKELQILSKGKPTHFISQIQKRASFPDFVDPSEPSIKHFKMAKKIIAIIAKESGLVEGIYNSNESKQKIDTLSSKIINRIDKQVKQFNLKQVIPFVLEKIDALIHKDELEQAQYNISSGQDSISDDLNRQRIKQKEDFSRMSQNYRYLIEKFVQLSPSGNAEFNEEAFMQIIALIDWFFVFVRASDQMHYNIFSEEINLQIDGEFKVDVVMSQPRKKNLEDFNKYLLNRRMKIDIYQGIATSSNEDKQYLDKIGTVFSKNLSFSFRNMIQLLHILSIWGYETDKGEQTFYSATKKQIIDICKIVFGKFNIEIQNESILKIIDFLTLEPENMCRVIGKKDDSKIPVWESYKRHSRYTIRPLIEIDKQVYWGPYSVMKSGILWSGSIEERMLPIDPENREIEKCLLDEKRLIEKELEEQTFKIAKKYTLNCEKNVFLHQRDKSQSYPHGLGDYDVLSYMNKANIVLNIECKHLKNTFSLKGIRNLKEKLFGKNNLVDSNVGKALKRHEYLKNNWKTIFNTMKWPIQQTPQIISIFCSKNPYIWTYLPPENIPITFLCIDELDTFISNKLKR